MATPILNKLIRELVGSLPRPTTVLARLNVIKSALREIRSTGFEFPSAKSTLAAFRKEAFGITTDVFNSTFKKVSVAPPMIAKQQLYTWKQNIPLGSVPIADVTAQTKYLYKFTVNVYDKANQTWSEQWITLGTDTKLTVEKAWNRFQESYLDVGAGGISRLYANDVDTDSVEFQGVWRASNVVREYIE